MRLDRLKKRADFLRAARGTRVVTGAVIVESIPTPEALFSPERWRVGFTASKKIGNAPARNRAKRRLRAAAAALMPLYGKPGHDYVLVARTTILTQPYNVLLEDITEALRKVDQKQRRGS